MANEASSNNNNGGGSPKAFIINSNGMVPLMPIVPVLVLDIDGTVIRNKNGGEFINWAEEVELFPGAEKKIWEYRERGYLILGISNQGGVAHGHQSYPQVSQKFDAMLAAFDKNPFHLVKFCCFDPAGTVYPYDIRSLCRKPDYGLLAIAENEFYDAGYRVDWDNSLFVGDRLEDAECARLAHIPFDHADHFFERDPHPSASHGEDNFVEMDAVQ